MKYGIICAMKEEIKSLKISVEKLENERDGLGSNLEYILEKSKLRSSTYSLRNW